MKMRINPFPSPWSAKFKDLPTIQILTNLMSDEDVSDHGDLIYWRSLMQDVIDRVVCDGYKPKPWPTTLSDDMNAMTTALAAIARHPDPPGELLARWKLDGPGLLPQTEA